MNLKVLCGVFVDCRFLIKTHRRSNKHAKCVSMFARSLARYQSSSHCCLCFCTFPPQTVSQQNSVKRRANTETLLHCASGQKLVLFWIVGRKKTCNFKVSRSPGGTLMAISLACFRQVRWDFWWERSLRGLPSSGTLATSNRLRRRGFGTC